MFFMDLYPFFLLFRQRFHLIVCSYFHLSDYQFCSSVDSGIVVQFCQNDRSVFTTDESVFFVVACHCIYQRLTCFGYTTTNDDYFRVNYTGKNSQCGSQILGKFIYNLFCNTVAFFICVKDGFCAEIIQMQFCLSSYFSRNIFYRFLRYR